MLFSFGRDVNINWKHGVNALPSSEHNGKGRISIVIWGLVEGALEEEGSPPMVVNSKPGVAHPPPPPSWSQHTLHDDDGRGHSHGDGNSAGHGRRVYDDRRGERDDGGRRGHDSSRRGHDGRHGRSQDGHGQDRGRQGYGGQHDGRR